MTTPLVATQTQERTRLPVLRSVMIAGLVGNVVMNVIVQALIVQALIVPLTIISVLTLVIAGVCATRWRWAPLLAVLWVVVSVVPGAEPYTYNLTHPAETALFISTLISLMLLLITVVAGVAATVSGERQGVEESAPRWLLRFLIGTASFVLGASLVAAIPPVDATAGVSAEALAQLPALTTSDYRFEQTEIRAKVGEMVALRLDNADTSTHYLDIDELNVHALMPAGKSNVAIFTPTQPGTYTFYCRPHADKSARTGMVGTLIIEP